MGTVVTLDQYLEILEFENRYDNDVALVEIDLYRVLDLMPSSGFRLNRESGWRKDPDSELREFEITVSTPDHLSEIVIGRGRYEFQSYERVRRMYGFLPSLSLSVHSNAPKSHARTVRAFWTRIKDINLNFFAYHGGELLMDKNGMIYFAQRPD